MKKILCILLTFIFICSGCKKSSEVTCVTAGLSFNAEVKDENGISNYKVIISKNRETLIYETNNPGLKYKFSENKLILSYNNLSQSYIITELPKSNPLFLYSAFAKLNKEDKAVYKNKEYILIKKTDKFDYKIKVSNKGIPIEAEEKNNNLKVKIKNLSLIK